MAKDHKNNNPMDWRNFPDGMIMGAIIYQPGDRLAGILDNQITISGHLCDLECFVEEDRQGVVDDLVKTLKIAFSEILDGSVDVILFGKNGKEMEGA